MRILGVLAILAAGSAAPAYAQDTAGRFVGGHVELIAGGQYGKVDVEDEENPHFKDLIYGIAAGFDVMTPAKRGAGLFGVEAEVTRSTLDRCEDDVCLKGGTDFYVGGRLGAVVQDSALIYGKLGYARANVRAIEDEDNGDVLDKTRLDGVRVGFGAESNPNGGPGLVKAEYRYTNYEKDFSSHQVVLGLGIRF